MNEPRFEVYPQHEDLGRSHTGAQRPEDGETLTGKPTGEFGWRFRDSNGRITFIGGEGFTRRRDAHRALEGAVYDVARLIVGPKIGLDLGPVIPAVDVNEEGDVIDVDEDEREAVARPEG